MKLSEQDVAIVKSMYQCNVVPTKPTEDELFTSSCEDRSTMCGDWADLGLCTTGNFVMFMLSNCQLSCKICSNVLIRHQVNLELGSLEGVEVAEWYVMFRVGLPTEDVVPFQIMHKMSSTEDWSYGMKRNYFKDEPIYGVYNLRPNTMYDFILRYSVGTNWSEFSDVVAVKTAPLSE